MVSGELVLGGGGLVVVVVVVVMVVVVVEKGSCGGDCQGFPGLRLRGLRHFRGGTR